MGPHRLTNIAGAAEDNEPIPWGGDQTSMPAGPSAAASSSRQTPPVVMVWRSAPMQHLSASTINDAPHSHSRSASIVSMGMNGLPSRSRVSMDALPGDGYDSDDDHHTITPSSSTASLPTMMFDDDNIRSPHPASAITPSSSKRPVGLGLTAVLDNGREWPPREEEADSDEDEVVDQHEMDSYMASHRAPVDAKLRSMPGVVGLGDGWAGGPQPKPKRRGWFRRGGKKDEPLPDAADPLALWATGSASSEPKTPTASSTPMPPLAPAAPQLCSNDQDAADAQAKWWKSRKNLFSSSQRVLPTLHSDSSPDRAQPSSTTTTTRPPSSSKTRGLLTRSRLNFGSMVDLRRTEPRECPSAPLAPASPPYMQPAAKRHSVAGFLRKAPPHPLELSHGNGSTAASKSQPVGISASSSQPSLSPSPLSHHPILRQAYARSESHLAGAPTSPGNAPRPAPLIINSGAFVNTAPMPLWRPPMMSPTPLLEVEEEDEDEHDTPESTDRPVLKRSATFGDENECAAQKKESAPPVMSPINGSPVETQRALSVSTAYSHPGARDTTSPMPPPSSFLGRIKHALSKGRGRPGKANSLKSAGSPMVPQSPRSFQSEIPATPHRDTLAPQPRSVGRGLRPRSRLFSRRREEVTPVPMVKPTALSKEVPTNLQAVDLTPRMFSPVEFKRSPPRQKQQRTLSRHVVESMVDLSASRNEFADDKDVFGSDRLRTKRTSWAAPLPVGMEDEDEADESTSRLEKRSSRVSISRFKSNKPRPALGHVFPRPPTEMQQPPSLHWAFPGSYSTPMLHKFGGSTLSLALDISAENNDVNGLADIAESPATQDKVAPRERAISATIATLTARQPVPVRSGNVRRRTIPVNMDNLNSSSESLTLPSCSIVDFPLPPSSSSGDVSSPDPDAIEHLRTPRDPRTYPTLHGEYYRRQAAVDSGDSSEESAGSASSKRLRKAPSWSTCMTSTQDTATPLATPTSVTSASDDAARCGSFGSLTAVSEGEHRTSYMSKRASVATTPTPIVA